MLALEGIRVIDWTHIHAGPAAGCMLADLGAEVIHVERRGVGDMTRGLKQVFGVSVMMQGDRETFFEDLNRNKKSITLDLSKPEGKQVMRKLVERSDIFLTNMRRQAIEKHGLDYETLSKINNRLIYGWGPNFGDKGPEVDSPGYELITYAKSGSMFGSGEQGMPPAHLTMGIGDRIGGIFLAYGAIVSLFVRERTGIGQKFVASPLGGMITLQSVSIISQLLTGKEIRCPDRTRGWNPLYNWYPCKDGEWIALGMAIRSERYWPTICKALGMPELIDDPRFCSNESRATNSHELISLFDKAFSERSYAEWEKRLNAAGEVVFSKINNFSDIASDPQLAANNYIIDYDHPVLGPIKCPGFPVSFSETPPSLRSPAPECGEHSEEVLTEICGYSWEEVEKLRDSEVF